MRDKLEKLMGEMFEVLGYDLQDPHLKDSPKRIAKYMMEWHTIDKDPPACTEFEDADYDQMVVERDIPFSSMCAHHGLPFWGSAMVGYIPQGNILGLSKFARVIDHFANRFTVQERVTMQVVDYLEQKLNPVGVGLVLQARHMCMECRGVRKVGVETITTELRGSFLQSDSARAEFLSWVRR